jgi:hypothetical protein
MPEGEGRGLKFHSLQSVAILAEFIDRLEDAIRRLSRYKAQTQPLDRMADQLAPRWTHGAWVGATAVFMCVAVSLDPRPWTGWRTRYGDCPGTLALMGERGSRCC